MLAYISLANFSYYKLLTLIMLRGKAMLVDTFPPLLSWLYTANLIDVGSDFGVFLHSLVSRVREIC
jgi:hypothetical protein